MLHLGTVTDLGVLGLFFLHGMGLSTDSLKDGASRWRLHLVVQVCTYVWFPALVGVCAAVGGIGCLHDLQMGFSSGGAAFYRVFLGGRDGSGSGPVAAAVLNATLSTLLGVF